jgi:hypothetical protein
MGPELQPHLWGHLGQAVAHAFWSSNQTVVPSAPRSVAQARGERLDEAQPPTGHSERVVERLRPDHTVATAVPDRHGQHVGMESRHQLRGGPVWDHRVRDELGDTQLRGVDGVVRDAPSVRVARMNRRAAAGARWSLVSRMEAMNPCPLVRPRRPAATGTQAYDSTDICLVLQRSGWPP